MIETGLSFTLRLTLFLIVAFTGHAFVQHYIETGAFEKHIVLTYSFNFILAVLFFFILLYFKEKKSTQLGFIFLFSSVLKFILFLIFLGPILKTGEGLRSAEFASFFIPYSVSLSAEVYYLSRILSK